MAIWAGSDDSSHDPGTIIEAGFLSRKTNAPTTSPKDNAGGFRTTLHMIYPSRQYQPIMLGRRVDYQLDESFCWNKALDFTF